jgi:hypothetical protein
VVSTKSAHTDEIKGVDISTLAQERTKSPENDGNVGVRFSALLNESASEWK